MELSTWAIFLGARSYFLSWEFCKLKLSSLALWRCRFHNRSESRGFINGRLNLGFWTRGVVKDVGKDGEFCWTQIIHFLFIGNFSMTRIFDLLLSSEALVTLLQVGDSRIGGSEKENPRGDSRSFPFPSLISTNSCSDSINLHFWFPIYNKKELKIIINILMNWIINQIEDINLFRFFKKCNNLSKKIKNTISQP